jgi:hypothetical protein
METQITIAVIGSFLSVIVGSLLAYIANKKIKAIDIEEPLKELSTAKNVQEITASQINILSKYYDNALIQSQKSFNFALAAAGLGLLFFLSAGGVLLIYNFQSLAMITTLGGTLSGFVSAVNFYMYNKSSSQLADFHQRLDKTQRFLLSDGICNSIKDPSKQDATRADLIMTIVGSDLKK